MGCSALCNNGNQQIASINIGEHQFNINEKSNCTKTGSSPLHVCSFPHKKTRSYCETKSVSELSSVKNLNDYFPSTQMLREINLARTDPLLYIEKVKHLKDKIKQIQKKNFLSVDDSNNLSLKLNKGQECFDNCIAFLEEVAKRKKKLSPLVMNENLKVPFPVQSPLLCVDKEYIKNIILFKTGEQESKMNIIDFHYDVCFSDPELSTLMQIIDDTNSHFQRRKNIFNPKAKYIGISEGSIKPGLSCYYLMFAE